MKKLLLVGACLVATVGVLAQGKALFGNRISGVVDGKVLNETGAPADGTLYSAEAWAGPAGGALAAVAGSQSAFRTGAGAGYIPTITITLAQPQGASVDAQMRAWKGAPSLGWAAGGPIRGESATVTTTLAVDPTPTAALLPGMAGFTLVPEPSTIALAVLGAAALLLRRRK